MTEDSEIKGTTGRRASGRAVYGRLKLYARGVSAPESKPEGVSAFWGAAVRRALP
nr:hypothetical protein [uncultured Acetobacter sp.]